LLSFGILLLGFTDGRALLQRLRLRLHGGARQWFLGFQQAVLVRLGLAILPAASWAAFGPTGGEGSRLLAFVAAVGLMLGFWFLGTVLAGVVTIAERSVRGLWPRAFGRPASWAVADGPGKSGKSSILKDLWGGAEDSA